MPTHNTPVKAKSRFHLIAGRSAKPERLRQVGVAPSDTMPAGRYKVVCEAARVASKWGKSKVECSFRVVEGEHFGTALPGWLDITVINNGDMPGCQYITVCERILESDVEPGDDVDPESILVGKVLIVEARFRLTDGKTRLPQDGTRKKEERDFLRVCSILGIGEL